LEEHRDGKLFASYSYDSACRLIERFEGGSKKIMYQYDRNGNLIQKDNYSFEYDPLQRLRSVSHFGKENSEINYQYSPTGNLVGVCKSAQQEEEIAIYDGFQQIISEKQGGGKNYYWGFQTDSLSAAANFGQLPQRVYTNAVGSFLSMDPKTEWHEYDPFGEQSGNDSLEFAFGFFGKRYEPEINLYYGRARFYDPISGRYTQPDPLGTYDSLNLYLYAKNNPLVYTDPFGLAGCKIDSDKDAHGSLGVWPSNPDNLSKELGISPVKDFTSKEHGTRVVEWRSGTVKIRFEAHSEDEGEFNPRHHGAHYHVWIGQPGQGLSSDKLEKLTPLGYIPGQGKGFIPGEKIPAAVYWGIEPE